MPDKRAHRGPHPDDATLFAPCATVRLAQAADDLSWLLGRGYGSNSALKIVGDRYQLHARQRVAVARCACSDEARRRRAQTRVDCNRLNEKELLLDGYNVLTSVEAALAGGVILAARDGTYRDMASVHGTWRKVAETVPAAELTGQFLHQLGVARAIWYLDSPVSNSGRLKTLLRQIADANGWSWEIILVPDPDRVLRGAKETVATADSGILDKCRDWLNLARATIERFIQTAQIVDLSRSEIDGESTGRPS